MMHMTFYWGKQATILFDGWKTSTWANYSLSLLALFLVSLFLQYIASIKFSASSSPGKSSDAHVSLLGKAKSSISVSKKLLASALFGLRVGVGYLLMLAVMSFNGGVFIAVVLGFVVGHFLFPSGPVSCTVEGSTEVDATCCA